MLLSLQRKVCLSTDESTAVFPIVLENEERVYLCFCSSFGDSIADYRRRLLWSLHVADREKGNILERKRLGHLIPTDLLKKNRRTERTYRIGHFRLPKTLTFKKPFLTK